MTPTAQDDGDTAIIYTEPSSHDYMPLYENCPLKCARKCVCVVGGRRQVTPSLVEGEQS